MIIFDLAVKRGEGSQFWSTQLANRLDFFFNVYCFPVVLLGK